jgi:hypothetical protein
MVLGFLGPIKIRRRRAAAVADAKVHETARRAPSWPSPSVTWPAATGGTRRGKPGVRSAAVGCSRRAFQRSDLLANIAGVPLKQRKTLYVIFKAYSVVGLRVLRKIGVTLRQAWIPTHSAEVLVPLRPLHGYSIGQEYYIDA